MDFFPAREIDQPALARVLAVLMGLTAGIGQLHSVRAFRVIAAKPVAERVNGRLDPGLDGDAQVLKRPRAKEPVVQFQALPSMARVVGRECGRGILVGNVDDPHGGRRRRRLEILHHHGAAARGVALRSDGHRAANAEGQQHREDIAGTGSDRMVRRTPSSGLRSGRGDAAFFSF